MTGGFKKKEALSSTDRVFSNGNFLTFTILKAIKVQEKKTCLHTCLVNLSVTMGFH
jgi:hypothetical protein